MIYSFSVLGISSLGISGPDPFNSDTSRNSSSFNTTTITRPIGTKPETLVMQDDETNLHDGDSSQELTQSLTLNGLVFGPGTDVEIEYSYVLMPQGSTDWTQAVTIYAVELNADVMGVTWVGDFQPGVTYVVTNSGSDDPSVSYDQLPICFRKGTPILTARGLRPVEMLREGDLVQTADSGWQPVRWVMGEVCHGLGAQAPVQIAAGALGNAGDIWVSPNHRLLLPAELSPVRGEALVPAKALTGLPGITRVAQARVGWWHLMFDQHEVIFADGMAAESLMPGPQVWKSLPRLARVSLAQVWPRDAEMAPARQLLRPGQYSRLVA